MNTITNNFNNVSFGTRYIDVATLEKIPPRISEAILKNPAIDEFIKAGKPKTFWSKLLDIFTRDEVLDVYHVVSIVDKPVDPYKRFESLHFEFGKGIFKSRCGELRTSQEGVLRDAGTIAKPNEHPLFKEPKITATEKLARMVEEIKDFDKFLK